MTTELITLVRAVQTCAACPSQWDAWDADGQYYYLRYRYGHGTVETAPSPKAYEDPAYDADLVAEFQHGHPLEGEIGLDEFARRAGLTLALDVAANADA